MKYVEYKGEKYEIKEGFLDLGLCDITDITEIKKLDSLDLTNLELSSNNIIEIKGLDNLRNLEILNLGSNNIEAISGLDNLSKLIGGLICSSPNNQQESIVGLFDI